MRKRLAHTPDFLYNKNEYRPNRSSALHVFVLVVLLLGAASIWAIFRCSSRIAASAHVTPPTLVIDAGHGGIDGGAISADGTKESDINLAVALRLESIVRFCGQKTVMTRWDDSKKTDILSYSEHEELRDRADLVNKTENAVLISIHQNCYPTAQPRGAQVLYSSYGDSDRLGKRIQELLVAQLDPQNRRLAAPAPSELYLTAHARCPAVLVECGFMSNNFEVLKLKENGYQNALALLIAAAYLEYISGNSLL
ncbi:MAG: N-acetylmuramoyl-L-alanine amidase [Oscillospiraceae bacterium]|nr:N-acetylmuramoyl-L-alanine amidase [Oscillospiraceae bacterium]